jgi:hypothetical protein
MSVTEERKDVLDLIDQKISNPKHKHKKLQLHNLRQWVNMIAAIKLDTLIKAVGNEAAKKWKTIIAFQQEKLAEIKKTLLANQPHFLIQERQRLVQKPLPIPPALLTYNNDLYDIFNDEQWGFTEEQKTKLQISFSAENMQKEEAAAKQATQMFLDEQTITADTKQAMKLEPTTPPETKDGIKEAAGIPERYKDLCNKYFKTHEEENRILSAMKKKNKGMKNKIDQAVAKSFSGMTKKEQYSEEDKAALEEGFKNLGGVLKLMIVDPQSQVTDLLSCFNKISKIHGKFQKNHETFREKMKKMVGFS